MKQPAEITVAVYTAADPLPDVRAVANDLQPLQDIVGGWLEAVALPDGLQLLCNEEGRLQGLHPHHAVMRSNGAPLVIVGDFLVCRTKGGEFASLRDGDIVKLRSYIREV